MGGEAPTPPPQILQPQTHLREAAAAARAARLCSRSRPGRRLSRRDPWLGPALSASPWVCRLPARALLPELRMSNLPRGNRGLAQPGQLSVRCGACGPAPRCVTHRESGPCLCRCQGGKGRESRFPDSPWEKVCVRFGVQREEEGRDYSTLSIQ